MTTLKTLGKWLLLIAAATLGAETLQLAENGKPLAKIVLEPNAPAAAKFAARELQYHLKQITGGDFPVVAPDQAGAGLKIRVGDAARKFAPQTFEIRFAPREIVLAGADKPDFRTPKIQYDNANGATGHNWPGLYDAQGTMYAVYTFLRDDCGVRWLDPSDFGTVVPRNPDLTVPGKSRTGKPAMSYRGGTLDRNLTSTPWLKNSPGWKKYMATAYPAIAGRADFSRKLDDRRKLWLMRNLAGGDFAPANHSFYNYYERFLNKKHPNFESYHPEYFATGLGDSRSARGFIDSGFDARKEPPQLCYSNPATVAQAVQDARNYFDRGGYAKRYRTIGAPGYIWGENNFCLEPMDNGGFCRCPNCSREYEPNRKNDHSEHSTHWFRFVNKVAAEIAKSHPGKKLTTLAYMTREGLPTNLKIADNVVVYFCLSANRMPYTDLYAQQFARLRQWRKAYPHAEFGLWLYNTFPHERTIRPGKFHCFPGFFAHEIARQYQAFADLGITRIFHCGFVDDLENYLNLRYMVNPREPLEPLLADYFAAFGKAAAPMRKFYERIEKRYCDRANYPPRAGHQNEKIAWVHLGTDEVMADLEKSIAEAEKLADTPQAKARVAAWKTGYWAYMKTGKTAVIPQPCGIPGVTVVRTRRIGGMASPFGESILAGRVVTLETKGLLPILDGKGRSGNRLTNFTDGKFGPFFLHGNADQAVYHCELDAPRALSRLRFTVAWNDPARGRVVFTPIVRNAADGVWKPIASEIVMSEWDDGAGTQTFDLTFAPGTVANVNGVGWIDNTPRRKWNWPRWMQIEAR